MMMTTGMIISDHGIRVADAAHPIRAYHIGRRVMLSDSPGALYRYVPMAPSVMEAGRAVRRLRAGDDPGVIRYSWDA